MDTNSAENDPKEKDAWTGAADFPARFTEEAGCGGPGPQTASVYLMHFCAHTAMDLEASKNESSLKAAGADQANRKLFQVLRAGQPCSRVHKVQAGSPKAETLVGSLDECKLACGAEVTALALGQN